MKKTISLLLATILVLSALALAAFIASTAVLAGCGGGESSDDSSNIAAETQIVTRVVNGVYTDEDGNPIKDENGQPMTAPSGTPDTKIEGKESSGSNGGAQSSAANNGGSNGSAQSSAANNSGNSGNKSGGNSGNNSGNNNGGNNYSGNNNGSNSGNNSGGNSGGNSSKSGNNSGNQSGGNSGGNADSNSLSIGGKSYKVGDTVTCTYTLTCKKLMANFQAYIDYDGKHLKPTNAYLDGPAKAGSVINYELYDKQKIKFNGINLNGYNYTKGANFLVVQYEVLAGGSSSPKFVWQISTDTKDKPLVVNGKATSDISLNAAFS